MQPEERDAAYLWDMLSAAREVQKIARNLTLEAFRSVLTLTVAGGFDVSGTAFRARDRAR